MRNRKSCRLKNWDYSSSGYYFITICIRGFEPVMGIIDKGKVILSDIGRIIEEEFLKSFEIRKELVCHEYIIMPDHIHMIVEIKEPSLYTNARHSRALCTDPLHSLAFCTDVRTCVRTKRSISSFIAGFKSSATKKVNEFRDTPRIPLWLPRFYDRIIRNQGEFNAIRRYIRMNPFRA
jgi:putative transposase